MTQSVRRPVSPSITFGKQTVSANEKAAKSSKAPVLKTLLAALGIAGVGLVPTPARAEISPESGKIVQWANNSIKGKQWKDLSQNEWNNVIVALRTTDNIGELDFHPTRMKILKEAPTNPYIPLRVVQEAVDTAGVLAENLKDEHIEKSPFYKGKGLKAADLKKEISDTLKFYAEKQIVDSQQIVYNDGKPSVELKRSFVPVSTSSRASDMDDENPFGGGGRGRNNDNVGDFSKLAQFHRIQIGDKATMENLAQALLKTSDTDKAQRENYFDTLRQTPVKLPDVEKWSLEQVFSTANLKKHYAAAEAKAKGAPAPAEKAKAEAPKEAPKDGDAKKVEAKTTEPGATPKTNPAASAKSAVVGKVEALDVSLRSPQLTEVKTENKLFVAKNIEYLARNNNEFALPAIGQWFINAEPASLEKDGNIRQAKQAHEADFIVLKSLAQMAQKDDKAFDLLKQVTASNPILVALAHYGKDMDQSINPMTDAGIEIGKAFAKHQDGVRQLLKDMNDSKATTFWSNASDSPTDKDKQMLATLKKDSRWFALGLMASDQKNQFLPELRKVAFNDYDDFKTIGMYGLARGRDYQSIPKFLETAGNSLESEKNRGTAMMAVLTMFGPPEYDPNIQDKVNAEQPYNASALKHFFVTDAKSGAVTFDPKANPFENKITAQYKEWEAQQQRLRDFAKSKGQTVPELTVTQKMMKLDEIMKQNFGSENKALVDAVKANPEFQEKYLQPLFKDLSGGKIGNTQMQLKLMEMEILGRAGYKPAADTLANFIKKPTEYVEKAPPEMGMFGAQFDAMMPAILRFNAMRNFGNVVDPASKDADLPHLILKDPTVPYQFAGMEALRNMGNQEMSKEVRQAHIGKAMDQLKRIQKEYHDIQQNRWIKDILSYEMARTVDALGGKEDLLKLAWDAKSENPKAPIIRSVVHALVSNGTATKDLEGRGFEADIVGHFQKGGYWGLDTVHKAFGTGDGAEELHFDVGYVSPVADLKGKVQYPDWIKFSDANNWDITPHATSTANTVRQTAPGLKTVHSYNVAENLRLPEFQSDNSRDPFFKALEEALQDQMRADGDPKKTKAGAANYSIGFNNLIMYNTKFREEFVDLLGAYMEGLGQTGVTSVVSAGNSQTGGPGASYDPVGTVNTLGTRNKNGKITKNDATQIVAAADGFLKWLAEFSSMNNPLRLDEALPLVSAPGYQELTLWKDEQMNNKWNLKPIDGTSFSAPRTTGLILVAQKAREKAGLPAWTQKELEQALRASTTRLPGRESWEGGDFIDPLQFLQRATQDGTAVNAKTPATTSGQK